MRERSAIEMAEMQPPRWAVHPMRVIFMISCEPSPALENRQRWSLAFHYFVNRSLVKVGAWRVLPPPRFEGRRGQMMNDPVGFGYTTHS